MADAPLTLEAAAQQHAALYADDDRQDIGTDVFNAFAAGAKWATSKAPPSPPVAAPAEREALLVLVYRLLDQCAKECSSDKMDLQEWLMRTWHHRVLPGLSQPPRPGTAPLSDAQIDRAVDAWYGYSVSPTAGFRPRMRGAIEAAGHSTTPTPKD